MGSPPAARPARAAGRGVRFSPGCVSGRSPCPPAFFSASTRMFSDSASGNKHSFRAAAAAAFGGESGAAIRTPRTPSGGRARRGGSHNPHTLGGRARRGDPHSPHTLRRMGAARRSAHLAQPFGGGRGAAVRTTRTLFGGGCGAAVSTTRTLFGDGRGAAIRTVRTPFGGGRVAATRTPRTPFGGWARRGGPHTSHTLRGMGASRRSAHLAHPRGMGAARRSAQSAHPRGTIAARWSAHFAHPSGGGRGATVRTPRTPFLGRLRRGAFRLREPRGPPALSNDTRQTGQSHFRDLELRAHCRPTNEVGAG